MAVWFQSYYSQTSPPVNIHNHSSSSVGIWQLLLSVLLITNQSAIVLICRRIHHHHHRHHYYPTALSCHQWCPCLLLTADAQLFFSFFFFFQFSSDFCARFSSLETRSTHFKLLTQQFTLQLKFTEIWPNVAAFFVI